MDDVTSLSIQTRQLWAEVSRLSDLIQVFTMCDEVKILVDFFGENFRRSQIYQSHLTLTKTNGKRKMSTLLFIPPAPLVKYACCLWGKMKKHVMRSVVYL
jgi:hypothetical protein